MEQLEPVMECTGFSSDEAAHTVLLWEEISGMRAQGLSTVNIVHRLTRRLKCASVSSARARAHLTEKGRNAAERFGGGNRKQRFSGWVEDAAPPPSLATAKRSRLSK
jgi:prophage DNA circulation protein